MSYPSFIIFKATRRFQAGHFDNLGNVKTLTFRGRDYHFVGQFVHYCQITDEQKRLLGFVVMDMTDEADKSGFSSWFNNAENGLHESDWFHFFIRQFCPEKWHNDGSLLISANLYSDDHGDFLITIPDSKSRDKSGPFQNLWSEIAFPLAPAGQFVVKEYFPKRKTE